jgi:hypothetical protein
MPGSLLVTLRPLNARVRGLVGLLVCGRGLRIRLTRRLLPLRPRDPWVSRSLRLARRARIGMRLRVGGSVRSVVLRVQLTLDAGRPVRAWLVGPALRVQLPADLTFAWDLAVLLCLTSGVPVPPGRPLRVESLLNLRRTLRPRLIRPTLRIQPTPDLTGLRHLAVLV